MCAIICWREFSCRTLFNTLFYVRPLIRLPECVNGYALRSNIILYYALLKSKYILVKIMYDFNIFSFVS